MGLNEYDQALVDAVANIEKERDALRILLGNAIDRMNRARSILTNGTPTPECNWGMLDTSDLTPNVKVSGLPQPEGD